MSLVLSFLSRVVVSCLCILCMHCRIFEKERYEYIYKECTYFMVNFKNCAAAKFVIPKLKIAQIYNHQLKNFRTFAYCTYIVYSFSIHSVIFIEHIYLKLAPNKELQIIKIIINNLLLFADVESDVIVPERRPHFPSSRGTSPSSRRSKDQDTAQKKGDDDTSGWDSTEDTPIRRTTRGRGKRRSIRDRRLSEDATDSDAPRGSQDTDDEETTDLGNQDKNDDNDQKEDESKAVVSQLKRSKRRSTMSRDESKDQDDDNTADDNKRFSKDDKSKDTKAKIPKHQDDDTDDDEPVQEPGIIRPRPRSSRLSDLVLRKKSLSLNLNTSRMAGGESPAQDSTSHDEDSGSCSDVFDDSPLTETKKFQVKTKSCMRIHMMLRRYNG